MNNCCGFCGKKCPAGESDWIPYFYFGEMEISNHVCPECESKVYTDAATGEEVCNERPDEIIVYEIYHNGRSRWYFFKEPGQDYINYLLLHRPGATATRSIDYKPLDVYLVKRAGTKELPLVFSSLELVKLKAKEWTGEPTEVKPTGDSWAVVCGQTFVASVHKTTYYRSS